MLVTGAQFQGKKLFVLPDVRDIRRGTDQLGLWPGPFPRGFVQGSI